MVCYYPKQAIRSDFVKPNGKSVIIFNPDSISLSSGTPLFLPCSKCIGCRLMRSRNWAIRCVHEAKCWKSNCFITLTYADSPGTLVLRDFQLFMKRLRKHFGNGVRFFHTGEYGERFQRPHYHALLFNCGFDDDKYLWQVRNDVPLYRSPLLERLWPFGHSSVGDVTFNSAAYVARYIMKKVGGEVAFHHYNDIDYHTGEILASRIPEYSTMSRRHGIGKAWYELYKHDWYKQDLLRVGNKSFKPPKYYDSLYELDAPEQFAQVKANRLIASEECGNDSLPDRLRVRRVIKEGQINRLIRPLGLKEFV